MSRAEKSKPQEQETSANGARCAQQWRIPMTSNSARYFVPFLVLVLVCATALHAQANLSGNWTGTFTSNHSDIPPFFLSVIITSDNTGRLTGNSTLEAKCMKNANLNITIDGTSIIFAGNDGHGDNLTIRGTLDPSGTIIDSTYIMNASQGGACETDDGKGSLQKR